VAPVLDTDGDDDLSEGGSDPDHDRRLTLGHAASETETRATEALVRRYYVFALADDGRRACTLVYWLAAEAAVEASREDNGPPSLRGDSCAQVATRLFARRHRELVEDGAEPRVSQMRVRGEHGWVVARFRATRERLIEVHREHGGWKLGALFDAGAP
jgi:hypothetical protein